MEKKKSHPYLVWAKGWIPIPNCILNTDIIATLHQKTGNKNLSNDARLLPLFDTLSFRKPLRSGIGDNARVTVHDEHDIPVIPFKQVKKNLLANVTHIHVRSHLVEVLMCRRKWCVVTISGSFEVFSKADIVPVAMV